MERGSFIQTVSGRRIDPLAPDMAEIDLGDIAQALSNQCRFGGHCRVFYSVAEHSCHVADVVEATGAPAQDVLWALLHDAAEAYLVDLPHPLKHRSELGRHYRRAEAILQLAICERFGLPPGAPPALKAIDRAVLATERRELMADAWAWPELDDAEPAAIRIEAWPPARAAHELRRRFDRLSRTAETAGALAG